MERPGCLKRRIHEGLPSRKRWWRRPQWDDDLKWLEDADESDESARFARSSHRIQVEIEVIVRISVISAIPIYPQCLCALGFLTSSPGGLSFDMFCFCFLVLWFFCYCLQFNHFEAPHCHIRPLRFGNASQSLSSRLNISDTKWNTRCATRWSACSDFSAIYQWLSGQLGRNCQRSRGHQMQSPEIAIWKAQELNSSFIYESMIYIYNII